MTRKKVDGWDVSKSADIAFTLVLMAIFGRKAPGELKIFISALAVSYD